MRTSVKVEIRLDFLIIFVSFLIIHIILLVFHFDQMTLAKNSSQNRKSNAPLIIKDIRKIGMKNSKSQNDVYLSNNKSSAKKISKAEIKENKLTSLNQLGFIKNENSSFKRQKTSSHHQPRPGTLPSTRSKAISGIGLRGNQMKKFLEGNSKSVAHDDHSHSLSNSDVAVNLEVPEGVQPDELNKFELMFYGFQRRTAINYINAFYKNLDKFKRTHPHLKFPLTDTRQIMTGRLTYDEKGNVKQIKMIRWSNVEKLQDFFLDVLKDMDTLHNPPQALWKKSGEFSIYFSFVVNG